MDDDADPAGPRPVTGVEYLGLLGAASVTTWSAGCV
jgi:hypothetical protein